MLSLRVYTAGSRLNIDILNAIIEYAMNSSRLKTLI